jgi:hypothetical protein
MLNPIPWYKSPVYVSGATTVVSTLIVLFPKAGAALGLTSPDLINTTVNAVFEVIALVAGLITTIARSRSSVQPIAVSQTSADAQKTPQSQAAQNMHDQLAAAKVPPPPTGDPK